MECNSPRHSRFRILSFGQPAMSNVSLAHRCSVHAPLTHTARQKERKCLGWHCDEGYAGMQVGLVLDTTPFYAEAGGQVSDVGMMETADGASLLEAPSHCPSELHHVKWRGAGSAELWRLHLAHRLVDDPFGLPAFLLRRFADTVQPDIVVWCFRASMNSKSELVTLKWSDMCEEPLRIGQGIRCAVDYFVRARVAPNHTMTHVLNWALRDVLGEDASQSEAPLPTQYSPKSSSNGLKERTLQQLDMWCQFAWSSKRVLKGVWCSLHRLDVIQRRRCNKEGPLSPMSSYGLTSMPTP
eukprot:4509106-Amphidinium_carterae.1